MTNNQHPIMNIEGKILLGNWELSVGYSTLFLTKPKFYFNLFLQ
jgi:hypothetical protein